MKLWRNLNATHALQKGAVAIGNFDGVHRGHAEIVRRLVAMAQRVAGPSVVFTFDPHPATLLRPQAAPRPLTTIERRAELLGALGVDAVLAYPTDRHLLELTAEDFFTQVVQQGLQACGMVEGANFLFGHDRGGDIPTLQRLTARGGLDLEIVAPEQIDGEVVSSSRIRALLAEGRIEAANALLTAPYRLTGKVVEGARRGSTIGFGTANLAEVATLVPKLGVYSGQVAHAGRVWPAAIHLGPNPTFGEKGEKIEVHLIDWQGELYGEVLEVDFLTRLRDIQRFASAEDLVRQLHRDIAAAQQVVAERGQGS